MVHEVYIHLRERARAPNTDAFFFNHFPFPTHFPPSVFRPLFPLSILIILLGHVYDIEYSHSLWVSGICTWCLCMTHFKSSYCLFCSPYPSVSWTLSHFQKLCLPFPSIHPLFCLLFVLCFTQMRNVIL